MFVRVRVTANPSDNPVQQGGFFTISGSVRPGHRGTHVIVQRKKPRGWVKVDKVRLGKRSRYSIVLVVNWQGERTFRVKWPAQDHDHEPNKSRALTLRAA
ncbi:MAG TPA: hypothetical protein VG929_10390 [Actinomycetota bacterium]|nr:hypothetical protein [Actinomycetota bacterium]